MDEHIFLLYDHQSDKDIAQKLYGRLEREQLSPSWKSAESGGGSDQSRRTAMEALDKSWIVIFVATSSSVRSGSVLEELNLVLGKKKMIVVAMFEKLDKALLPPRIEHRDTVDFAGDFEAGIRKLLRWLVAMKGEKGRIRNVEAQLVDLLKGLVPDLKLYPDLVRTEIGKLRTQLKASATTIEQKALSPESKCREDWGRAPDVSDFLGRVKELELLESWIKRDSCRLVGILGFGGMGKTLLATALGRHLVNDFDYVIWRSLKNAPPPASFLDECILFLSGQQAARVPADIDDKIDSIIEYLRKNRCLIILDDLETVFLSGENSGTYRDGYEGYGQFIRQVGQTPHRSVLMFTSREKPKEIVQLEGFGYSKTLQLAGIDEADGYKILKDRGINGDAEAWRKLISCYSGNLLALKLVSETIRELYQGNIAAFLSEGAAIFGDVLDLLETQFSRLSREEQEIMHWLAIAREPVNVDHLRESMISYPSKQLLLDRLLTLRRRSLIEASDRGFSLQNVILRFMTSRLVNRICAEIQRREIVYLARYGILQAQEHEYIRESQTLFILQPVSEALLSSIGRESLEARLREMLAMLRGSEELATSYAAGNFLNLLVFMQVELSGLDLSNLSVRRAYLQGASLAHTNFAGCDVTGSVFTDAFRRVLAVTFSPDGRFIAVGTSDRKVIVWMTVDYRQILTCTGHEDLVRSVAFNADSDILASGSSDGTVKLWDIATGDCLRTLAGHRNLVDAVAFSPKDRVLASASKDSTVKLWNIDTGELIRSIGGATGPLSSSVAYSPDGELLASGGDDGTVYIWRPMTGECVGTLAGHTSRILTIAFAFGPDGPIIASAGEDHSICLHKSLSSESVIILQGHLDDVWSVAFNRDGTLLASGSEDRTIRVWKIATGECIKVLLGHTNHVRSVAFNRETGILASGGRDSTVRLWDVSSAHALKTIQGYTNSVWALAFSGANSVLASGHNDHNIYLWDIDTGRIIRTLRGHQSSIGAVAFARDEKTLASGSEDHTIRLWDLDSGTSRRILNGHKSWVNSVRFSPDGRLLASCSEDKTVRIWDVETGHALKILYGHTALVWTVDFSPDGHSIASCGEDNTIRLWDVATGLPVRVLKAPGDSMIFAVSYSPDGRIICSSGTDPAVRLWDAVTGAALRVLVGHSILVMCIAFSPDGTVLASSGVDETVRLWDVSTGQCLRILEGHSGQIDQVEFSRDGRLLASASADETIRLWDVASGSLLNTLKAPRLCEGMNISGITGLRESQTLALKLLGAVDDPRIVERVLEKHDK